MTAALTILAALLLADTLRWHLVLARAVRRKAPPQASPEGWPSLTVVRPVKGADAGQRENFDACLASDYPGLVRTVFVFDDGSDPGLPNARAAIDALEPDNRRPATIVFAGDPPPDRTGKLHAMAVGAEHAETDLIAFGDSDTRPDPALLTELVATMLADEGAGCAFSPAVVVGDLRTSGDVGYALLLNSMYGPMAAWAAGDSGQLPFIMGQIMVFRPEALASVGGVDAARGRLVDDMAIGEALHREGWRNVMARAPLHIVSGGWSMGEFFGVYRRWLLFGKDGLGLSFTWPSWARSIEYFASLLLLGAALAMGAWWGALLAALSAAAFGMSLARLHRLMGGPALPARGLWMCWGLLLLAPAVQASMAFKKVTWRGREYQLNSRAELASDA